MAVDDNDMGGDDFIYAPLLNFSYSPNTLTFHLATDGSGKKADWEVSLTATVTTKEIMHNCCWVGGFTFFLAR